jgi:hypothetical protein
MDQTNPLELAAKYRVAEAADEIQRQLANLRGGGPLIEMLARAKAEATEAYAALAIVDPFAPQAIMQLQNRIRYFDEVLRWMGEISSESYQFVHSLSDEERQEIQAAIAPEPSRWERGVAAPLGDDEDADQRTS